MTNSQIQSYLSKLKYSMNTWIPFDEVGIIYLDQDGRLFPDRKTQRFNFNSNGVLEVVMGYEDENGEFFDNYGNPEGSYKVSNFLDFKKIFGFIRSVEIQNPMRFIVKQPQ